MSSIFDDKATLFSVFITGLLVEGVRKKCLIYVGPKSIKGLQLHRNKFKFRHHDFDNLERCLMRNIVNGMRGILTSMANEDWVLVDLLELYPFIKKGINEFKNTYRKTNINIDDLIHSTAALGDYRVPNDFGYDIMLCAYEDGGPLEEICFRKLQRC